MAQLIGREGPLKGLSLRLQEGDEWIIGRDPDESDLIVEESTVSRRHARLRKTPDGFVLENLSDTNPTRINGEVISGPKLLKESDSIQIGHTTFRFEAEEKKKKEAKGYDDIFADLEEELPPQEPKETPYDTIFEEEPKPEEFPFPIGETPRFLLKVLSGPNAGAEIGLETNRSYILGKEADACDIAFQDLSVSRTHARLTLSEEGQIEIEDLGSKNGTALNGSPITEKVVVTPQDIVSMGTTMFLILDREAPQETIYAPAVGPKEEAAPPVEELPTAKEEEVVDWKKQPIPTRHLIMAGSFAAIFLIAFISFFSLFRAEKMEIAVKSPDEQIGKALAKYSAVQFSYNPGSGKLFLVGHVLTSVDDQELRYRIDQLPFVMSVENTVVIDELVWKMMNDILSSNPDYTSVFIRSTEAGKFVATGYVDTSDTLASLQDYLTVNFPYLDRLDNQVVADDLLSAEIGSRLVAKGFNAVGYQLLGGDLVLTGRYSDKETSSYKELLDTFRHIHGIQVVKDLAVATHPNMAGVDLSSQYQVTGSATYDHEGFSVVVNGKIYTKGDLLDGMQITAIEPNTVLLEKDGLKYKIDYR